jgi:hypothetical protein
MAQPARQRDKSRKTLPASDPKMGLTAKEEWTLLMNEGKLGSRSTALVKALPYSWAEQEKRIGLASSRA